MSSPALSLAFFDPEHGLYGNARTGTTLLFEGSSTKVVPEGPVIEGDGAGWRAELDGAFSLSFAPVAEAAPLGPVTAHVCAVEGTVGTQAVRCLGTMAETRTPPVWDDLDALRTVSAVFDSTHAFVALARRPRGAPGHDEEQVIGWLLDDGEPLAVEDTRLSTVYDAAGPPAHRRPRAVDAGRGVPASRVGHGGGRVVAGPRGPRRARGDLPLAPGGPRGHGRVRDLDAVGVPGCVIRAVISDFGGVLTTPLGNSFAAWSRESGIPLEDLGVAMAAASERHGSHPLFMLEKGLITQAEFIDRLEGELTPGPDGEERRLDTMLDVYFDHLERNPEMIRLMRDLRGRGLRMALLTNNVREWEPRWRALLPEIDEIFELVVDSAFVGMRKPEPEIYALTVERLGGVEASECVFLDDIAINCDAARDLGMEAVHFQTTEQATAEIEAAVA